MEDVDSFRSLLASETLYQLVRPEKYLDQLRSIKFWGGDALTLWLAKYNYAIERNQNIRGRRCVGRRRDNDETVCVLKVGDG